MPILGIAGDIITRGGLRRKVESTKVRKARQKRVKRKRKVRKETKQFIKLKGKGRLRNFQLYALELENGHYYVGMTAYRDIQIRFKQHLSKQKGAKWTRLHKPIKIIETREVGYMYESEVCKLENDMTTEYIIKYGINMVRGGDMCQINIKHIRTKYNDHTIFTL